MFLSLLALVAVASAATIPREFPQTFRWSPTGRIVGGEDTEIEEVPYQVGIKVWGWHYCGGSIISENWIVTAGHCSDLETSFYSIHAGSTYSSSGGSTHSVVAVYKHENYNVNNYGTPVNDIALMRVDKPFVLDKTRQPINLFNENEVAVIGSISKITGWGRTGIGGLPEILQGVEVPIIAKNECNRLYQTFGGLPEAQICAAYPEGGKDACQGDSGGPLAIDGRLAGITSWGNGCALPNNPGVYTEVAPFRAWIKEKTGI